MACVLTAVYSGWLLLFWLCFFAFRSWYEAISRERDIWHQHACAQAHARTHAHTCTHTHRHMRTYKVCWTYSNSCWQCHMSRLTEWQAAASLCACSVWRWRHRAEVGTLSTGQEHGKKKKKTLGIAHDISLDHSPHITVSNAGAKSKRDLFLHNRYIFLTSYKLNLYLQW